jgi:thymidylate synthase (FAD)
MIEDGIAREVARMVLNLNVYTSWYATGNLRNWVGFLALRTDDQAMHEIRQLAFQTEELLTGLFPATMVEWGKNGREHI